MSEHEASNEKSEGYLWEASKQYMKGEISEKEFKEIEQLQLKQAINSKNLQEIQKMRELITFFAALVVFIWMVAGILIYVTTKQYLVLLALPIILLPFQRIISYYFSHHED